MDDKKISFLNSKDRDVCGRCGFSFLKKDMKTGFCKKCFKIRGGNIFDRI